MQTEYQNRLAKLSNRDNKEALGAIPRVEHERTRCPRCGKCNSTVVKTKRGKGSGVTRRRHSCAMCGRDFWSAEGKDLKAEPEVELQMPVVPFKTTRCPSCGSLKSKTFRSEQFADVRRRRHTCGNKKCGRMFDSIESAAVGSPEADIDDEGGEPAEKGVGHETTKPGDPKDGAPATGGDGGT